MTRKKPKKPDPARQNFVQPRPGKGRPGGRLAARRAAEEAVRLERRAKAWRLLIAGEGMGGTSFDDIGAALGVSGATAWRDCMAYAQSLRRNVFRDVEMFRTLQASQLAALKKVHWKKKQDRAHADVILRAMEREAKLLGLDRQHEDSGLYTAKQVVAMLQALMALFVEIVPDDAARARFADGVRRQIPAAARGVAVDAETVEDADADAGDLDGGGARDAGVDA